MGKLAGVFSVLFVLTIILFSVAIYITAFVELDR